jgi:3D (Asp-Asp-Asp) domain-containing protein
MSAVPFNARFIPQSSTQLTPTTWTVDAELFDGIGLFSCFDIQLGDIVFLDCFNSFSFPSTVNRYKVTQINSRSSFEINCDLAWDDEGTDIVDIGEVTGSAGFISRPSSNQQLSFHAAPTLHTIPDYVIQYARNNDMMNLIDPFGKKKVKNMTGTQIEKYQIVAWTDVGTVALADATLHTLSDIAGMTLTVIPNGSWGWILKQGYAAGALDGMGAIPGDKILLSPTVPGLMTKDPITDLDVSIIGIGRAEPPSGVASANAIDLHMELNIEQEI